MRRTTLYAVPGAALLLVVGCAGRQSTAETVRTPQQRSQQALEGASDAQKRANEQAERAADARQDVQKKQQELQAAQAKAEREQAKAEQSQQAASQQTQQATRDAQQAQQQASRALSQQTERTQQGVMTLRGQVSQASGDELVVKGSSGDAMKFRVTNKTEIRIDGQQANASEIQTGENALVAYDVGGTEPTARSIQIVRGNPAPSGSSSGAGAQPSSAPSTSSPPASSPAQQDATTTQPYSR